MNKRSAALLLAIGLVVFLANFVIITEARDDGGWGAIGMMLFYGPIANGVLAMLCLAAMPLALRYTRGAFLLYLLAIVLPVVAVFIDFGIIASMDLHGC